MKPVSQLLAAVVFAFASLWSGASHAAPQVTVLDESFETVPFLPGWMIVNNSTPQGLSWFQGNPGVFPAQQGPASSYIAASYLSAANGSGTVDTWLITPPVGLWGESAISFFTRADTLPGFADFLEVRFSPNGGSSDPADFLLLLGSVGGAPPYPTSWQELVLHLDFYGTGRFAFHYLGNADQLNYIGIDTVTITTVAEPAMWLVLAAALCALALQRRPFQESSS
jgi:hypothetical protein